MYFDDEFFDMFNIFGNKKSDEREIQELEQGIKNIEIEIKLLMEMIVEKKSRIKKIKGNKCPNR